MSKDPYGITVIAGLEGSAFEGTDPGLVIIQASQALAKALDAGLQPEFTITAAPSEQARVQMTAALDQTLKKLVKEKKRILH